MRSQRLVRPQRCAVLCVSNDECADCFENVCFGYSACESSTTATADRARKRCLKGSQPPSTRTLAADTPSSSVGTRQTPIWSPLLPHHRIVEKSGAAPRFRQLRNREEEGGAQSRAATGIQSRRASYHPLLHAQDHMVVQREACSRQQHTASRCG